jgi:cyanate permease
MRKRTLFGLLMLVGTCACLWVAQSNWVLAAIIGMGCGATVAILILAYPLDIAPPADRRHENTQRRKQLQRDSLR